MHELQDRQIVIFAGKGGVGKTTCSSATALEFAKRGRKTLLVTVDPAKRLEDSLGMKVGFKEKAIQPNLTALMLDPQAVITEHLEREIPEANITDHPLFRYVTNYLPGLNELMAIGKLNDLRKENKYDVIVVDTAPTGHALSFLSAPKTIRELMSDRSLIRWAIRGYAVWQKLSGAAKNVQNAFKRKDEKEKLPPDIDFERIFSDIQEEAEKIQDFLTNPEYSSLVLVTLPEKMPVEETCDLHEKVTTDLGMHVDHVIVNKMQPDALGKNRPEFDAFVADADRRKAFAAAAGTAQISAELADALVDAASFSEIRRAMNEQHVADLRKRLPGLQLHAVPLFKQDVTGLKRLHEFQAALFDDANRITD